MTPMDSICKKHVVFFPQERHFVEIRKSNAKNHTGLGWGIGALLIALTHNKLSYSYPLLMAVTHRFHGTFFNKSLYANDKF